MSPRLIALDWGTSSFRAALMAADGAVIDEVSSADGLLAVPDRQFEATLQRLCGAWFAAHPRLPVFAAGMIGSRQGWHEVPYVACPAGFDALAAGLLFPEPGRALGFVPGLVATHADGRPDVMRGEEVQILGALDQLGLDDGVFVLPGTHSKWVRVEGRRITGFHTFMTGELYALLRRQSILSRLMPEQDSPDREAFLAGCRDAGDGTLLHRLFSIRARGLFDQLPPAAAPDYLSGLLIGEEVCEALSVLGDAVRRQPVHLVCNDVLLARYTDALGQFGLQAVGAPAHASFRGLFAIARARGLID